MSTTGVSFKVEAQTPAADTLEGLARAAEHARMAEAQLGAQMKAVNAATVGHANAVQAAAKGMDAAGYAAGNLRFQMFDVGQSLAMGMNPMMVLAQQGPQVAQAFTQAGQAGSTMGATIKAALGPLAAAGPIMLAVAPAVLAAGAAYLYLSTQLEEAEEKATKMAATASIAAEANATWRTGTRDLADEIGLLSGELDKYDIAGRKLAEGVDAAAAKQRAALDTRLRDADAAIMAARAEEKGIVAALDHKRAIEEQIAAFEVRVAARKGDVATIILAREETDKLAEADKRSGKASDAAAAALRRYVAALQEAAVVQTALAGANADTFAAGLASFGEMADAARAASLSEEEQIEATAAAKIRTAERTMQRIKAISGLQASALETAEAEHQAAVTAIRKEAADAQAALVLERSETAAASFQGALESLVPASTLSDMDRLLDIAGKIAQAYADGAINAEQFAALSASVGNTQTGIQAKSTAGTAGKVGQAMSSPLSAAASLHPIAQAVYAGLQSAANMQDGSSVFTEAADMIQSALGNLGAFVESAFAAAGDIIANAPRVLIEALPEILQAVADGIPMLAQSVADMALGLVEALAEVLPQLIPELVIVLAQVFIGAVPMIALALASAVLDPAFYEAIGEAFVRGIEAAFERIGNVGEDLGQTLGTGTTAGGGFQLFGLPVVPATTSSSSVVIQPGDLWGDFTRAIGVEASKLGRT